MQWNTSHIQKMNRNFKNRNPSKFLATPAQDLDHNQKRRFKSGHQIIKLRSDNGGEYVNNKFTSFCTKQGIQQQHIVPYTPQQMV